MNKQEMFEFIRDNVSLTVEGDYDRDYGVGGMRNYKLYRFTLKATNPETGKDEVISQETITIELD